MRRTVLVVDDHPLFRAGFVAAWRRERPLDLVLEAGCCADAQTILNARVIDLLVADLRLPDGSGLALCAQSRVVTPSTTAVLLTTYDVPAVALACRRVGARGFFAKDLAISALMPEIDRLLGSPDAVAYPQVAHVPSLTEREREVLSLLMKGKSNPAIATILGVSPETVKTHVVAIFDRLGASDRFQAVEIARALGFDLALPYLGDGVRACQGQT